MAENTYETVFIKEYIHNAQFSKIWISESVDYLWDCDFSVAFTKNPRYINLTGCEIVSKNCRPLFVTVAAGDSPFLAFPVFTELAYIYQQKF